MTNYKGRCECSDVEFLCEGEPHFTQYCHCTKCRDIAALSTRDAESDFGFTAAFSTKNFTITAGNDKTIEMFRVSSKLILCKNCLCLIYGISLDPDMQEGIGINMNNFVDFKHSIPEAFKPVRHIWYLNRMTGDRFKEDGLDKYIDSPIEQFGSGILYLNETQDKPVEQLDTSHKPNTQTNN